jgi:Fic family protein
MFHRRTFNDKVLKMSSRTASKWAKLAKGSPDTALRDISDLSYRRIILKAEAGGRSTSYALHPSE